MYKQVMLLQETTWDPPSQSKRIKNSKKQETKKTAKKNTGTDKNV